MIDACKCIVFYENDTAMNRVLSKPFFTYRKEWETKITGEPVQEFALNNLRVKSYPRQRMIMAENSLHKFWHGNNYCDFTRSDLVSTTASAADIFERRRAEFRVHRFEFSLIIETDLKPTYYIDRFMHLRFKPFYDMPPPPNRPRPIERYCPFTQFRVKFYDAADWNGVKGRNWLKGEIQFGKMQAVYRITGRHRDRSPITFEDFTDRRFLDLMAAHYLKTYRAIEKDPIIDCSQLKPRLREFLFAGINPTYWEQEKSINPNTAKKKRSAYLRLRRELSAGGGDPYAQLERKFEEKYNALVNL